MDFQIDQYIVLLKVCQENVPCTIFILLYSFFDLYMFEPLKAIVWSTKIKDKMDTRNVKYILW